METYLIVPHLGIFEIEITALPDPLQIVTDAWILIAEMVLEVFPAYLVLSPQTPGCSATLSSEGAGSFDF